ncbi:glucosamine--fructose-6-phosphate aminotransferase [Asanoa ishikariensis]|uniref:Glutamine--fructose-6-phosphate aminotransferase [isomerizing] n=1 Tax=Asanoa ishikariensis TaxID=137265 RepID=A0A1H3UM43_9ACTN|nr:SIS domain-containing protein [Asanoa ishikariensis]GIF69922.1 glucosamine--fructose-6-phosphate aminotransferase [Asanoa ishikariensis]SDZ63512.1 glucosamine--fructose-6-phosphate aminotransferase (isomerizing) [Asanoa ishikariensis]
MSTPEGHITFAAARAQQHDVLEGALRRLGAEVAARQADGWFRGPGPIFVAIGASFAAACAPTWTLRSRGIHSWRLSAGDHPLPYPASRHPLLAVSQSGRSAETLAVLSSVDEPLRYAVTNADPSPIGAAASRHVSLGDLPDSYASTIGYTATVAGLGMIAEAWDGGRVDPGWALLPERISALEAVLAERADDLAATFAGARSADFAGAGPSVGSAEAGALLFREVVRLPATAMSTRQYLHGAMESAGGTAHVLIGGEREIAVARTLSGAGHPTILVTTDDVPAAPLLQVVRLPAVPLNQRAILEAIVLQVLVARAAAQADIDIEEFVFHHDDTKVPVL